LDFGSVRVYVCDELGNDTRGDLLLKIGLVVGEGKKNLCGAGENSRGGGLEELINDVHEVKTLFVGVWSVLGNNLHGFGLRPLGKLGKRVDKVVDEVGVEGNAAFVFENS